MTYNYHPTLENQGLAETNIANIAKQRNGISGVSVKLKFLTEYVKLVNLDMAITNRKI